jgi:superfamily I DNA/RNA helicase
LPSKETDKYFSHRRTDKELIMDLSRLGGVTPPSITLTGKQQAVVDSDEKAILVNAVAGSGKTATLMSLARNYTNGLYLAFNKAIVTDVLDKLPVGWSCKTFNSMGLAISKEYMPNVRVDFNKYKQARFNNAVNLAQHHMSMNGNDSPESWAKTADRFTISRTYCGEAYDILKNGKANVTKISGEDMLQYPIDNGWKTKHYDIVLVDECQDLNPQQIAFLACIPTDRIVFVGDRNQAIYGFRGSDPQAIAKIVEDYEPEEFEMNESFRCPTNIIKQVQRIVPNMMSAKKGGQVERLNYHQISYDDECFILCRVNSKLIRLAYTFIKTKQHFSIGANFIRQLEFDLRPFLNKAKDLYSLRNKITDRYKTELNKAKQNRWATSPIENKYDALLTLIDNVSTINEVKDFTETLKMHADGASARKLMTIHAAKGLESEHIYFLEPDIINYLKGQAKERWRQQEEDNLYYVACTRALSKLTFVS